MTWWLLAVLAVWLLFNWLAPLSLLAFAERMSVGRIPKNILDKADAYHVHYYVARLVRPGAFTTWLGWKHAVVLDRDFLQKAFPSQVRFVLAHELGHCALGHLKRRWFCTVTGLALLPAVREYLKGKEEEADIFAEKLTGLPRTVLTHPAEWAEGGGGGVLRASNE